MNPDNRIKLRHLNCFLEVARQGSIQRAADALAISQPAVSKTLRELEDSLDSKLFERGRQGVTLTDAGNAFLHVAGPSMQALRRGIQSLRTDEYKAGELRLGALSSVETQLVPKMIHLLHSRHLGLRISVLGGPAAYLLGLLRSAELDLVVGRLSDSPHLAGLHFEHLYGDALKVVVHTQHPLLGCPPELLPGRLSDYPMVLPLPDTTIRQHADSLLLQSGAGLPATCLETLSNTLARSYTLCAHAVWIAPRDAIHGDLEQGNLKSLELDGHTLGGSVGVCSNPATSQSLPAQWCLDALRELTGNSTPT
ncbi:pca operon transcription factor PcaQ [Halopseudomonas sp. Lyrl_26]|uniref:pca operon transcription factor PcaQ n=1 Tax=Halopseudomonas sp. Lyrl_26 TaxID=3110923 RepID=UPI003F815C83